MKFWTILFAAFVLVGCGKKEDNDAFRAEMAQLPHARISVGKAPPPIPTVAAPIPAPPRFKLTLVQQVEDPLAYYDRRGVYILEDTTTGQQFIGISGVGITELGRQYCGKACSKEVER